MLCRKIRPNEWSDLIREWRSRIRYVESRDDVVGMFRQVVEEMINKRSHSRNSVRLVDELAHSEDTLVVLLQSSQNSLKRLQSLPDKRSQIETSPHPSPRLNENRSMSLLDLSVPDLFLRHFKDIHHAV
jgi:uracil DNA glycosylase